jgi:toxin FitB
VGGPLRGLLDTSVLIATEVAVLPDEAAISAASLAELHFGVLLAQSDDARRNRLRRLTEIEARFDPLPVDAAVARSYGTLAHIAVTAGQQARRRVMDLLIAATAHAHAVPLYTRDAHDFGIVASEVEVLVV